MREYLHMGQRTGEVGSVVKKLRDWLPFEDLMFFNWMAQEKSSMV